MVIESVVMTSPRKTAELMGSMFGGTDCGLAGGPMVTLRLGQEVEALVMLLLLLQECEMLALCK